MPALLRVLIYKTVIQPALAGECDLALTGILIDKVGSRIKISLEEHRRDEEITSVAKTMPIRDVIRGGWREAQGLAAQNSGGVTQ